MCGVGSCSVALDGFMDSVEPSKVKPLLLNPNLIFLVKSGMCLYASVHAPGCCGFGFYSALISRLPLGTDWTGSCVCAPLLHQSNHIHYANEEACFV